MGGESVTGGAYRKWIRRIGRGMCRSRYDTSHGEEKRMRERDKGLGFLKFWNLQFKRYGGCSGD